MDTPYTDCYLLTATVEIDPRSGTICFISVHQMSVKFILFTSQLLNIFMFIQTFTHNKFVGKKPSGKKWEDLVILECLLYSFP